MSAKKRAKRTKATKSTRPRKPARAAKKTTRVKAKAAKSARRPAAKTKPARAAARKPKTKAKAPKKRAAARPSTPKPVVRRDGAGHLDPSYAAKLRELSLESQEAPDARAFLERPRSGDDLAEEMGEEAVETMTSGGEETADEAATEENGGPFVESDARTEFAHGTDPSNPRGAKREPFPTT